MEEISHPRLKDLSLDQVLKALGDPVRLSIVKQLMESSEEEKACGTFKHDLTKATFSHHVKILRDAGIVHQRQDGTRRINSLRSEDLQKKFPGLLEMIKASR
jgi:DNA-binding transcriptional ArsR family regulator